jgi:hypothetical protein
LGLGPNAITSGQGFDMAFFFQIFDQVQHMNSSAIGYAIVGISIRRLDVGFRTKRHYFWIRHGIFRTPSWFSTGLWHGYASFSFGMTLQGYQHGSFSDGHGHGFCSTKARFRHDGWYMGWWIYPRPRKGSMMHQGTELSDTPGGTHCFLERIYPHDISLLLPDLRYMAIGWHTMKGVENPNMALLLMIVT